MPFVEDDLKQVTTAELLALADECERQGMRHQLQEEVLHRLDADGCHILQAHPIHQMPVEPFVRARAMFSLFDQDQPSEIYFLDVPEDDWHRLPDCVIAE